MISQEIGIQVESAGLLEIGELGDFQAVQQHLPADAPGAQGGRFPVVFLEAEVVQLEVDAERLEAADVDVLHVVGRGLEDDLVLEVLLHPVGVLAVAAVGGAAGGHDIGHAVGFGPQHPEKGLGVHGAGADFHVVRLLDDAALAVPEVLEGENDFL